MKKFSLWMEEKDYFADSILGIFGGGNALSDQEKKHLLGRNTNEFSNQILKRVLNLGVVKSKNQSQPNNFLYIKNMIERGVIIKDLIDKLKGEDLAPNAKLGD